jgi:hypothetical protein
MWGLIMPEATQEELLKALHDAGLEKAAEGVVFPWGFKIIDFDGKKAMQPLTPDEFKEAVLKETGKTLTEEELMDGSCVYLGEGRCHSQGCDGACNLFTTGGFFYCRCMPI